MLKNSLICLPLLIGCAAQMSPPTALTAASLPSQTPLRYSFRPMAFDGDKLWQLIREPGKLRLAPQTLTGQALREVPLQAQDLPEHVSLSWGQDRLWLLDRQQTLHQLNRDGKAAGSLKLSEFTYPAGLEQVVWIKDQLWVLHRAYLDTAGRSVPTTFYRIDPASGQTLQKLEVKDTTFVFAHTNLSADDQAFYVARGHIFDEKLNLVYRIDRSSAKITTAPLGRIHTGMTSLFMLDAQLLGIEMVDLDSCGEYCRGRMLKLAKPGS